jgi:AcrR family transcriptional regulator
MTSVSEAVSGPAEQQPGRRERKRREVRDRLCSAALQLFVERGYEATTIDQIAERADVARATVFNYFPQKVGFLEEWGTRRRATVALMLDEQDAGRRPAPELLRLYLRALAALNEASRAETPVLMDAAAHFGRLFQDPSLGAELARIIQAGQEAGQFASGPDPGQVGSLLAAGYFTTVLQWADGPAPFDLTGRLDAMLDLVLPALTDPPRAAPV